MVEHDLPGESLDELYDDAPCGYISTGMDGTCIRANRTLRDWLGYQHDEYAGVLRFQDLLSTTDQVLYTTYVTALTPEQSGEWIALRLKKGDGQWMPVCARVVQRRGSGSRPVLNRITVLDAAEHRRLEQEIRLANERTEVALKTKARFLSTLNHELRTPLSTITLISQLLDKNVSEPKHRRYIHNLRSAAQNLLTLVTEIVDYHKIDSGQVVLDVRPFTPRTLIHAVYSTWEAKATAKQLVVEVAIDDEVPTTLLGDALKLELILDKLIDNAIKFSEQGTVSLSLRVLETLPESVVLGFRVQDTGIGIAQERLGTIFEEFMRSSSDTRKSGGTGLGLAMAQKLVQLHGSTLLVESTVGAGSTFSFNLPLARVAETN